MDVQEISVLVVGAGPAGLTAAISLARSGIDCMLVEHRRELCAHPRATTISTRTMELLRSWGLEAQVLAGGIEVDWLLWRCDTLARVSDGVGVEVGLPTRAQAALISPTAPACVPQDHLEAVLFAHLRSLPAARVELGAELVGLDSRPDGVRAAIRSAAGETNEIRARYLVGADGAHSSVRDLLEIPMHGSDDVLAGITALVRAPLWEILGEHRYGIYAVNLPGDESIFLPAGPGDRWRFGYVVDPSSEKGPFPAAEQIAQRIRRGAGIPDLPVRIESTGSFSSAAQLAETFRREYVFLIGDAAHRVTPRGGTGMNTAIHDGYDLGWKLAWVLQDWTEPDLLDTYERERRPVAEHNVARSADPEGSIRAPEEELRADLGGRIPHHWIATPTGGASTLDLLGPGLTLFTGPHDHAWHARLGSLAGSLPLTHRPVDELSARALGLRPGGALLTRPDGTPHAWWPEHPTRQELRSATAGDRARRPEADRAIA
jgi:putative polyketide hydroxylase